MLPVGAVVLALGVLAGAVVGARSLWGRMSKPSVGVAAANAATQSFVLVTFVSNPPGAKIVDAGGREIGTTPATLPVTPSRIAVPFRFDKDGFRSATSSIIADGDKTLEVELKPVRRAEKPAKKAPAKGAAAKSAAAKRAK